MRQSTPAKVRPLAAATMMAPKILKSATRHSQGHRAHSTISHPSTSKDTITSSNIPSSKTREITLSKAHSKEHTYLHVLSDNLKQMLKIVDSPMA